jgi:hypothetical protein
VQIPVDSATDWLSLSYRYGNQNAGKQPGDLHFVETVTAGGVSRFVQADSSGVVGLESSFCSIWCAMHPRAKPSPPLARSNYTAAPLKFSIDSPAPLPREEKLQFRSVSGVQPYRDRRAHSDARALAEHPPRVANEPAHYPEKRVCYPRALSSSQGQFH